VRALFVAAVLMAVPGVAAADGPPEISFGGFAAFDYYQYLERVGSRAPRGTDAVPAVAQVRIAPRLRAKYRFVMASAEVEFRHEFLDPGRGNRVILREVSVGLRKFGLEVKAGALQVRWGKMDVASPTDNLTAWDYEELLFAEPLPIPAFQVGFARGMVSAELIFVPASRVSRFRRTEPSRWDNRWRLPRTQTVPTGIFGDLTFENNYAMFEEPVLTGDQDNLARPIDLGARVDLFLPSVDLGLSFAMTRDKLPTFTHFQVTNGDDLDGDGIPDHVGSGEAILRITPHHNRLYIPGFDVAVNVWRLVFKAEASYFHTTDADKSDCLVDDPYIKYAVGAELRFPELAGAFGLSFRLQYNGDITTATKDQVQAQSDACPNDQVITIADEESGLVVTDYESGFQATPDIRHPYKHAFYWNFRADFPAHLALDVRGFATVHGDALVRAHLHWEALERMTISAGGLVMLATGEDTLFTPYGRNSRVEVGMTYRF
jgi:hypothetical protein